MGNFILKSFLILKIYGVAAAFFLLWSISPCLGQDIKENSIDGEIVVRKFDKKVWNELRNELEYNIESKSERKSTKDLKSGSNHSISIGFGKISQNLIFIILIVVFVFVLFKILNNNLQIKNLSIRSSLEEERIEENIHSIDLKTLLKEAIERKEYKLAVRFYYLIIIKELSNKNLIDWQKEKTNWEYLKDMKSNENYGSFQLITYIFDEVWYGNRTIEKNHFEKVVVEFEKFNELINN